MHRTIAAVLKKIIVFVNNRFRNSKNLRRNIALPASPSSRHLNETHRTSNSIKPTYLFGSDELHRLSTPLHASFASNGRCRHVCHSRTWPRKCVRLLTAWVTCRMSDLIGDDVTGSRNVRARRNTFIPRFGYTYL